MFRTSDPISTSLSVSSSSVRFLGNQAGMEIDKMPTKTMLRVRDAFPEANDEASTCHLQLEDHLQDPEAGGLPDCRGGVGRVDLDETVHGNDDETARERDEVGCSSRVELEPNVRGENGEEGDGCDGWLSDGCPGFLAHGFHLQKDKMAEAFRRLMTVLMVLESFSALLIILAPATAVPIAARRAYLSTLVVSSCLEGRRMMKTRTYHESLVTHRGPSWTDTAVATWRLHISITGSMRNK